MMKRIFSLLLALCLIVGLLPAVAMPHAHAEEAAALETAYELKFGYSVYSLTKYDTPLYFVNQAFEEYDAAATQAKRTFYRPSTADASEDNWNAKLIWHTGDNGPTLYLDGFRYDEYDNEAGTWKGTEGKGTAVSTTTGITTAAGVPTTIVLTGEDSLIETSLFCINFQGDLTIVSEGDTKLAMNGYNAGLCGGDGADLIVDANLDASAYVEWSTARTPMATTNGNITINGGNINLTSKLARLAVIKINTSGSLIINGGNVTVNGAGTAIVLPADSSAQINGGSVEILGPTQVLTVNGGATLPTVPEGACVVVTYRYWNSYNPVTTNGFPTSITRSSYMKITYHANRTEVAAVAPDCVNDGTIQHWTCDACGKNFAAADTWTELESIVDPSVGEHAAGEIVKENEVAADCENDGTYEAVTYCTGCGIEMSRTTVDVAHLGHTEVAVEQVDPTTTTVGTTAGTKCSVCGIVLSGCEEIPMLKKAAIRIMSWSDMTADESGKVSYYKTYSQQGYTSDGVENGLYWTVKAGNADDWNIKFEYPLGGVPTLTFKDATLDHIGEDGKNIYKKNADGTFSAVKTLSAVLIKSGYVTDLKVILQGNNHIETDNGIIRGTVSGTQYFKNITIIGEDGGSLTGTGKAIGISVADGYDLTVESANIDIYTTSEGGGCIPFRTVNGDITITNSSVKLSNTKNCTINAETSGNIVITDSVLDLNAIFTNASGVGAINACTSNNTSGGTITVTNSQITATSNGSVITGFYDVVINGGSVSGDVRLGICSIEGDIKINGGEIEITSEKAFNGKTPDLSGYEGWNAVVGTSKETAVAVTDASALASAEYVKISAEPIEPACDHTNTTTTETVVKEATCTEAGSKTVTVTCECGETISEETVEIAALGHTEEVVAGYAATCTETGLTDGVKCSVCGETLTAQEEIPALGHTEETIPAKECTCTATGLTEGKKCSVCGETLLAQEVVAAKGHTEEVVAGYAATCTETGLTDGVKCSVCGETITAQEEIPALGHTEETVVGKAATCTETGLTDGVKCSVCGETLTAQEEIAALGHTEETVVGKAATCTETGLTDGVKCSVCGETLTAQEEIPALGHTEQTTVETAEATCTSAGAVKTTVTCEICGEIVSETVEEIPALGHSYADDTATECAVCGAARATVTVVDDTVTVNTNGMTGIKVHVFNITGKEIADINVWADLKAADANFVTYSKNTFELANGTYVLRVQYTDAEGAAQVISYQVTIDYTPAAVTPPAITVNDSLVSVNANGLTGVKVHVFNVADKEIEDINSWTELKAADPDAKTYVKDSFVLENGTYVLRVQYNNADGDMLAESQKVTINYTPVEPTVTVSGKTVTVKNATVKKVHVFYVEGKEIADIEDWSELKAADSAFKSYKKTQIQVKNSGDYVVRVEYVDENGVAHQFSQIVTAS